MSSQKTERLINLTLALLATNRYLTKNEIFQKIPGYSGSPETKERMFERDKDELRGLGIEIEVNSFDPLFDDEQGYLIKPEAFQLDHDEFSKEELLLLTMAANLWHESALAQDSQGALLKIQSLSGPVTSNQSMTPHIRTREDSNLITFLVSAIENRQHIEFIYSQKPRIVRPFGLYIKDGFWYLVAEESEIVKRFKILRIVGKPIIVESLGIFTKPAGFNIKDYIKIQKPDDFNTAVVKVRKGTCLNLRNKFNIDSIDESWELIKIPYELESELLEKILWYGPDIELVEPKHLRKQIISNLTEISNE
jgi:proteasome accessory factor B